MRRAQARATSTRTRTRVRCALHHAVGHHQMKNACTQVCCHCPRRIYEIISLSTPAGGDRQRSDGESESVEVSTPQHYRMSQPKPVVVHPACRNAPPLRRAVAKQSGWKPSYRSPKPTELDISSDERSCPCPNGRQQSDEDCLHMSEDRSQMKNACKLQTEVRRCLPAHVGRRNSDDVCLCDTQARLENVLQGAYGETTPFPRRATR